MSPLQKSALSGDRAEDIPVPARSVLRNIAGLDLRAIFIRFGAFAHRVHSGDDVIVDNSRLRRTITILQLIADAGE